MRRARRRFLSLASLALVAGAPGGVRAAARAPIEWRDVTLLDGTVLAAGTLRGAPVVVEFWASWCPFCARQNPHLQALWEAQRAKGLRVLTFSIDQQPGAARHYMASHHYTFPAAMDLPITRQWFGARRGLPMLYVVDAQGRVVLEEAGEMFGEDVAELARFAPGTRA
jgi:thiol-disulfide isomerase/thioredoxin